MDREALRKEFEANLEKGVYPVISLLGLAVVQLTDAIEKLEQKVEREKKITVNVNHPRPLGPYDYGD